MGIYSGLVNWMEGEEFRDPIIERGMFCIFCRREMARSRWWSAHWRHMDHGGIICPERFAAERDKPRPRQKHPRRVVTQK